MSWVLWTVVALIVIISIFVIATYNTLKSLQVKIQASIQEIGNQLKRQIELIPNLESTVKGAAQHEQGIFNDLASARSGINQALTTPSATNLEKADQSIQSVLSGMRVVMESNPEMKANANFSQMMTSLEDTADKVMYSRRLLIDLSARYNEKLQTFPSNLVANLFHFQPEKGLSVATEGAHVQVSANETETPKVQFD